MIREQIIETAKNYEGDKISFVDGAEWMQSVLIEKVCKAFCANCDIGQAVCKEQHIMCPQFQELCKALEE